MAATTVQVRMQQRRDSASDWVAANPVLLDGELGYETDTGKFKIGNGGGSWTGLGYISGISADFLSNPQTLSYNTTVPASTNAAALGPSYTVATGVTLTISTGSTFRVI